MESRWLLSTSRVMAKHYPKHSMTPFKDCIPPMLHHPLGKELASGNSMRLVFTLTAPTSTVRPVNARATPLLLDSSHIRPSHPTCFSITHSLRLPFSSIPHSPIPHTLEPMLMLHTTSCYSAHYSLRSRCSPGYFGALSSSSFQPRCPFYLRCSS